MENAKVKRKSLKKKYETDRLIYASPEEESALREYCSDLIEGFDHYNWRLLEFVLRHNFNHFTESYKKAWAILN